MDNYKLYELLCTCAIFEFKILDYIEERDRLLVKRDALIQQAEKVLSNFEVDSNNGNEIVFLAYSRLKDTIVSLYDKVEDK